MIEMKNELHWVCGASSGIGRAVAESLAKAGASLVVMSRSEEKLTELIPHLKTLGAEEVFPFAHDISKPLNEEDVQRILGRRKLSGLLVNAGGPPPRPILSLEDSDFDHAHKLLFSGVAQFILKLLPQMQDQSSIVAITSTTIKEPIEGLSLSAAYRSGLVAWLKYLANALGERKIRVNNVAPGYTRTDRLESVLQSKASAAGSSLANVSSAIESRIPLGRLAEPAEVASMCKYLLSSESGYITGQTFLVDGGVTHGY